ncbi:MAG TPA: hypothetical protein VK506_12430 [Conexibacter sp.]|nr:hypothetical protein [Conexibacter sp.]
MGVVEGVGPARPARDDARVVVDPGSLGWVLAIPVALLALALILLLGPPLGELLGRDGEGYAFWQELSWAVNPEPTEQGRFLLALAAPFAFAGALAAAVRRGVALPPRVAALGVPLAQALLLAFVLLCVAEQQWLVYEVPIYQEGVSHHWRYFTPATLVVAVLLAGSAGFALARADTRARLAALVRETPGRRVAALVVAVLATALWLLHALNTDASIMGTTSYEWSPAQFTLDETYAILNGRTPLVDFTAQYGSLWPYATALSLLLFGETFFVFSLAMCTITAVALVALYAVLRRVTRNGVTALLLFLPVLATSLFKVNGTLTSRYTFGDYFGVFPLRYAGPFLLAWLVVRQLDPEPGGRDRRLWLLFAAAGLVVLNNAEFGVVALVACVAALLWAGRDEPSARTLGRLVGQVALGLAAAYAAFALFTLVRAGELPQLGRLLDYSRLYADGAFGLRTVHADLGLHLVIYMTYVVAIAVASVRRLEGASNRPLTGMLAWSGVFGLGCGAYFIGRSHPELLIAMFPVWALTLALLTVDAIGRLAARPAMRPGIGTLLVLTGMAVCVCSLAQTPLPWTQLDRLAQDTPTTPLIEGEAALPDYDGAFLPDASTRGFFTSDDGAPVAILLTTGHQIAHAFDVDNVSRYTGMYSMVDRDRLRTVVEDLRAAGGTTLFLPETYDEVYATLEGWGFERQPDEVAWGSTPVSKWVDTSGRGEGSG